MPAEWKFPALMGQMGDRPFYMTTLSLKEVARFFQPTPAGIPAEQRAQRALNERRVPEISRYLIEHDTDWVFGSLTVSYEGEAEFRESRTEKNLGTLVLDPATDFVIVDGQHRLAAIQSALKENPMLGLQQVGVMLLAFEDLDRNQQVFSDLNRTVQKTSRSLDILYDHSDPVNGLVLAVAAQVPIFQKRVEKNAQSLALRSPKFVTLSSLYDACQQLIGGASMDHWLDDDEPASNAQDLCVSYWTYITGAILPWTQVLSGEIKPSEARTEYVAAHSVSFFALGYAGAKLLDITGPEDWKREHDLSVMDGLKDIDWSKTDAQWQGITMLGHSIVTRRQTRVATARFICHKLAPERFPAPPPVLGE